MGNEFLDVLRMDCVQNRVEVGPVREPILGIGVLHVLHDTLVQCKLWEDMACSKLIKLGHVDKLAFAHLQKLLLAFEDLAKEVSVARRGRRDIVLYCTANMKMNGDYLRCSLMYVNRSCFEPNLCLSSLGQKAAV